MTIEKLQKIATSQVDKVYKAKWLRWWNSSTMRRAAYRFPSPNFREADLDFWLNKATFWAQVVLNLKLYTLKKISKSYAFLTLYWFSLQLEDHVVKQCNELLGDEVGEMNWNASGGIKKPSDYVESWRILLWDKAFQPFLNPAAKPAFLKSSTFEKHPGALLVVNRVFYRYVIFLWSSSSFFFPPPFLTSIFLILLVDTSCGSLLPSRQFLRTQFLLILELGFSSPRTFVCTLLCSREGMH